ncbi:hypothetical protein DBP19_24835 [Streptomyces sp. CS090A]|nr:hypothetical protein DBP19_24835 [Streptomyces sp. CS090A]
MCPSSQRIKTDDEGPKLYTSSADLFCGRQSFACQEKITRDFAMPNLTQNISAILLDPRGSRFQGSIEQIQVLRHVEAHKISHSSAPGRTAPALADAVQ